MHFESSWFHFGLMDTGVVIQGMIPVVERLLVDLRAAATSIYEASKPLVVHAEGIKLLPEEIVFRIFDHFECPNEIIVLGRVCRMFRNVSLRPLRAWTTLKPGMSSWLIGTCLERSKQRSLVVVIDWMNEDKNAQFFDFVVPACARWRALDVNLNHVSSRFPVVPRIEEDCLLGMHRRLHSIHFPILKSVNFEGQTYFTESNSNFNQEPISDVDVFTLISSLKAAMLQKLMLRNVIPRRLPSYPMPSSLELIFRGHLRNDPSLPIARAIMSTFNSPLHLKSLAFTFFGIVVPREALQQAFPVEMPFVEEFSLSFSTRNHEIYEQLELVSQIMASVRIPNVVDFRISITVEMSCIPSNSGLEVMNQVKRAAAKWLPNPLHHNSLAKLSIKVILESNPDNMPVDSWLLPLDLICRVETVSLSLDCEPVFIVGDSDAVADVPQFNGVSRLKRLTFEGCSNISAEALLRLVKTLHSVGATKTLEAVELKRCYYLTLCGIEYRTPEVLDMVVVTEEEPLMNPLIEGMVPDFDSDWNPSVYDWAANSDNEE